MKERILIIDDEKSLRVTFEEFLTDKGYEALLANDYESALEVISQLRPDIVFADIVLGARTGIDVLREVKKRQLLCPVIMITGDPCLETAADADSSTPSACATEVTPIEPASAETATAPVISFFISFIFSHSIKW